MTYLTDQLVSIMPISGYSSLFMKAL